MIVLTITGVDVLWPLFMLVIQACGNATVHFIHGALAHFEEVCCINMKNCFFHGALC